MIRRDRALAILQECSGDEIWGVDHCRLRGVPEPWITELQDAFESAFADDRHTIYVGDRPTNQYHGVRDVDLAIKSGESLGIDVSRVTTGVTNRRDCVIAIKQAVMQGD